MTILLMEGFDLYPGTDAPTGLAANWQISMSYASITMAAGRFGGRCLRTVWAGATDFACLPGPVGSDVVLQLRAGGPDVGLFCLAVCLAARSDRRLPVLPAHRQPGI
jgi:hypothetical protein